MPNKKIDFKEEIEKRIAFYEKEQFVLLGEIQIANDKYVKRMKKTQMLALEHYLTCLNEVLLNVAQHSI